MALELAAWGTDVDGLAFMTAPPAKALRAGQQLLVELGAVDEDGRPTPTGHRMLGLPVHPRLAAMLKTLSLSTTAAVCRASPRNRRRPRSCSSCSPSRWHTARLPPALA